MPRETSSGNVIEAASHVDGDRIDSWKEIATYMNRTVRTVQRWEQTEKLPVHRRNHDPSNKAPVYAYKHELDAWLRGAEGSGPAAAAEPESTHFVATSATPTVSAAAISAPAMPVPAVVAPPQPAGRRNIVLWAGAAAGVLLISVLAARNLSHATAVALPNGEQLTDYPGVERNPAFSPDGKQVAFSWNGKDQDNFDIYVRPLRSDTPLRLTTDAAGDMEPAWSPDGQSIAFFRRTRAAAGATAIVVPSAGGSERVIAQCPINMMVDDPAIASAAWTRDGKWLILPAASSSGGVGGVASLVLVSVTDSGTRQLTTTPPGSPADCCPAMSPDGRELAFLRSVKGGPRQIYLLHLNAENAAEGEPVPITSEPEGAIRPTWADGGKALFYLVGDKGEWGLRRLSSEGRREVKQLGTLPPTGADLAISPQGDLLAFSEATSRASVWRMDLRNPGSPTRLVSSSRDDSVDPQYSPDGTKLAYGSRRADQTEIRISDTEGNNSRAVAVTPLRNMAPPRWSPDGRQLVFECMQGGSRDICTVPVSGGEIHRLNTRPAQNLLPNWSRDGKFIYFTSDRDGSFQVWKIPVGGTDAQAVRLTGNGGFGAMESADGATIYYMRPEMGVFRMPARGGAESAVDFDRLPGQRTSFEINSRGIYYPYSTRPEQWVEVWQYPFAGGKPASMGRVDGRLYDGLSVSPDGRYILVSAFEGTSGDIYTMPVPQ